MKKKLTFNRDKFKIKHILGIEKELDSWPDANDLIYILIKKKHDHIRWNGSMSFSDIKIKHSYIRGFDDKVDVAIEDLIKQGIIKLVSETEDKKQYMIIKNPFE